MPHFNSYLFFILVLLVSPKGLSDPLKPAGEWTSADLSKNAFSHPFLGIDKQIKNEFFVGNSFFKQSWVQAPSSTSGRDGLGPTYNAVACASCHVFDGRGPAYLKNDKLGVSLLFRLQSFNGISWGSHPHYGNQLNPFAIDGVKGEVQITHRFETVVSPYPDGSEKELKRPVFLFNNWNFGPLDLGVQMSPRISSPLIGLALIESILDSDILKNEDPLDLDQDGVSGVSRRVTDVLTQEVLIGRFGWKAEQPHVRQQVASAFLGDIGITSLLFPDENCPLVQLECANSIHGGTPELEDRILDRVTTYSRYLAVPKSRHESVSEYESGLALFRQVGCLDCHVESFVAGSEDGILNPQTIYPFSDFLIHDMGPGLSDFFYSDPSPVMSPDPQNQGDSFAREWRTPPLWGIGLLETVNGHQQLLHDGRANGVEEAILWHGGEAENSKNNFKSLTKNERDQLIHFVNNL